MRIEDKNDMFSITFDYNDLQKEHHTEMAMYLASKDIVNYNYARYKIDNLSGELMAETTGSCQDKYIFNKSIRRWIKEEK